MDEKHESSRVDNVDAVEDSDEKHMLSLSENDNIKLLVDEKHNYNVNDNAKHAPFIVPLLDNLNFFQKGIKKFYPIGNMFSGDSLLKNEYLEQKLDNPYYDKSEIYYEYIKYYAHNIAEDTYIVNINEKLYKNTQENNDECYADKIIMHQWLKKHEKKMCSYTLFTNFLMTVEYTDVVYLQCLKINDMMEDNTCDRYIMKFRKNNYKWEAESISEQPFCAKQCACNWRDIKFTTALPKTDIVLSIDDRWELIKYCTSDRPILIENIYLYKLINLNQFSETNSSNPISKEIVNKKEIHNKTVYLKYDNSLDYIPIDDVYKDVNLDNDIEFSLYNIAYQYYDIITMKETLQNIFKTYSVMFGMLSLLYLVGDYEGLLINYDECIDWIDVNNCKTKVSTTKFAIDIIILLSLTCVAIDIIRYKIHKYNTQFFTKLYKKHEENTMHFYYNEPPDSMFNIRKPAFSTWEAHILNFTLFSWCKCFVAIKKRLFDIDIIYYNYMNIIEIESKDNIIRYMDNKYQCYYKSNQTNGLRPEKRKFYTINTSKINSLCLQLFIFIITLDFMFKYDGSSNCRWRGKVIFRVMLIPIIFLLFALGTIVLCVAYIIDIIMSYPYYIMFGDSENNCLSGLCKFFNLICNNEYNTGRYEVLIDIR